MMARSMRVVGLGGSLRAASTSRTALQVALDGAAAAGAASQLLWVRDLDLPPYTAEPLAAIREELRLVEEDLARLRETAADLRRLIGERANEPTDPAERSALIEAAEEQEALAEELEARREELLRRLGER
jgi:hypothetical protein